MKSSIFAVSAAALAGCASASVYIPYSVRSKTTLSRRCSTLSAGQQTAAKDLRLALRHRKNASANTAMAIPGYGVTEQVLVGGFSNFLSIYNLVITARILLSWFPQAQGIGLLQPVFAITDPYLNLFRGLIPPIFGLDLSPILAFFLLSVLTNATAAVGAEIPPNMPPPKSVFDTMTTRHNKDVLRRMFDRTRNSNGKVLSMNY
jgi:YggT family protein